MPPIQDNSFSCKFCQALLESAKVVRNFNDNATQVDYEKLFENYNFYDKEDNAPIWVLTQEEINNGCEQHAKFYDACAHTNAGVHVLRTELTFNNGKWKLTEFHKGTRNERGPISFGKAELLLVNELASKPGLGLGRVLDSQFIDPALIRQWKKTCLGDHGAKCSKKLTQLDEPLLYLIDTKYMCLVNAADDMAYVTLSYVWGQTNMLKTSRENVGMLQERGSLVKLEDQIPATIRDAIKLVPLLDERYLWVDSLCIIQDDEVSAYRQINQMAAIYEKATLTIVASDGEDATAGLPGIRGVSNPRQLSPRLRLTPGVCIAIRKETYQQGPWTRRGWTMQEDVFSRRKLILGGGTVKWVCRSSMFYEDVDSPRNAPVKVLYREHIEELYSANPLDLSLNVPDLSVISNLIFNYSCRDLTYDEDIILALSSTLKAMRTAFPHGFIYGLPLAFFDYGLLWRAWGSGLDRRRGSREGAVCPPSWSWAGWLGPIDGCPGSWSAETYMKNQPFLWGGSHQPPFQVIPLLKWSTKVTQESPSIPIPFQNTYYDYKTRFMGKEHGLPSGWKYKLEGPDRLPQKSLDKREGDPDCPISYDELRTDYYYEYESCPEIRFWHPVPISPPGIGEEHEDVSYGRYLCAETQQARLWGVKPRFDESDIERIQMGHTRIIPIKMFGIVLGISIRLRNDEGEDVGELSADMQDDYERAWNDDQPPLPVDVVVVSCGRIFPCPQPVEEESWNFYNVLWVEWEGGLARRKGVGKVERKAWDRLEKKNVSLVLE
ncbi:hypothetical protein FSARC_3548 [Fusarium sarcochroum]|uniref:Heterokaryon incompatibility domain-containing protein n=1 Tax=Fusarium sarcochroum TaxID=1208366 RepID=A0A8H4U3V9_9HYPO|nr:hypothetical protein FSARC_3548 [Fusarium sarcochroum]